MKLKNILKPENWWMIILTVIITWMFYIIIVDPEYNKAFFFILPGLKLTFLSTIASFVIALFLGLISGIGRISNNKIASTLSRTYIEFIRGVPVLILIFTIAFGLLLLVFLKKLKVMVLQSQKELSLLELKKMI